MSYNSVDIFTDGACSGNPGPAGVGVVILHDGKVIQEISRSIGLATNNIAEYTALIDGLQEALRLQAKAVRVKTDSELMAKQLNGIYAVKHDNIKPLFEQIKQLIAQFSSVEIAHIPREQNKAADKLSRQAILRANSDGRPDVTDVREESPSSKG